MMKCEFSCQSLELISHLVQPVCLNNSEEDAAFLYPTNCRYFLLILFIHIFGRSIHTYFFRCKVSASHISASTRCLILRIFSKTLIPQHYNLTLFISSWATKSCPGFCRVRFFTYLSVAIRKQAKIVTRHGKGTNKIWETHTFWRNFFYYGAIWCSFSSNHRFHLGIEMHYVWLSI